MATLALVISAAVALAAAYLLYGRFLSKRVFDLSDNNTTPANELQDGKDFVPTKPSILFGHHFTSIAGTGPIVGPAIAVMWGWLPALLWVILGSIFIGAVHDLGSLVVSLRNKGRTVGDIAGDLLGPRARLLFLCILIGALWIVLAIFGLVIAGVLREYPQAITPVILQVPLALVIGLTVHRRGKRILLTSLTALALMYTSVYFGDAGPLHDFNLFVANQPMWIWIAVLLGYSYVASVLPVWTLLQPRDYINALQLVTCLVLIIAGLVAAALFGGPEIPGLTEATEGSGRPKLELVAPMIDWQPLGAPPLLPVLFITVACGACSGFHCLVSSGTSSKQVAKETHAKPVAYGSMLTEALLATLVIAACAAGIGLGTAHRDSYPIGHVDIHLDAGYATQVSFHAYPGDLFPETRTYTEGTRVQGAHKSVWAPYIFDASQLGVFTIDKVVFGSGRPGLYIGSTQRHGPAAFSNQYASWQSANSLADKVSAFVQGAANFVASLGFPRHFSIALMAVMVASFAATTLDTSCRLQRYVTQELARTFLPRRLPGMCKHCGYQLTKPGTCPECGTHNTAEDLATPPFKQQREAASPLNPFRWLATTHGATAFACTTAFMLAVWPVGQGWPNNNAGQPMTILAGLQHILEAGGTGGLLLWPVFGATNQLLAGFAFVVITMWLITKRKPVWMIIPPAVIMLIVPAAAMIWQAFIGNANNPSWLEQNNTLLVAIASLTLALEIWLIAEVALHWKRKPPKLLTNA